MSVDGRLGFVCSTSEAGLEAAWVHVAGALDIATAPQLERALAEAQARARLVVLDLRELTFMDAAGVHALVDASAGARKLGRRLILLRGVPDVDRLFALTGNAGEIEIADIDVDVLQAAPPDQERQRSLVSRSLLRTGERARGSV